MLKEKSWIQKKNLPIQNSIASKKPFKSRSQITTRKYICVDSLRISYGVIFLTKVNIFDKQKQDSVFQNKRNSPKKILLCPAGPEHKALDENLDL